MLHRSQYESKDWEITLMARTKINRLQSEHMKTALVESNLESTVTLGAVCSVQGVYQRVYGMMYAYWGCIFSWE